MKATFMQRMVWLAILELLREAFKFSLELQYVMPSDPKKRRFKTIRAWDTTFLDLDPC